MPSTRRAFLATAGTTLLGGCASVDLSGSDEQRPPPEPFLTEPDDWEHPDYDAANTNSTAEYALPATLTAATDWTAEFTARTIDSVAGPVVADGLAYLVVAGIDRGEEFERLVAVDSRTGEERWRFEVRGDAFAYPPTVGSETVFWLASGDNVHALRAADGTVRWTHDGRNHSPPVVAHGLVLAVGGTQREPVLEALDPETGTPYWNRSEGERDWHLVAADGDATYVTLGAAIDSQTSELHALDPHTGETRWTSSKVAPREAALGPASLLASTGRPDARELLALDLETRETTWSETVDLQRTVGANTVNGERSVAAVTERRLLVHHDFHGYAHDRVECRELGSGDAAWTVAGTGDETVSLSPPVVAGDRVFLTEHSEGTEEDAPGRLRVYDLDDGTERRTVPLSERSIGSPVVADERIFLATRQSPGTAGVSTL